MDFRFPIISLLLYIFLIIYLVCPIYSLEISSRGLQINQPATKTIQSPDGDIIDCVMFDKQPAFNHPLLKGHKLLNPPKSPREHNQTGILSDNFQLWTLSGETCPDGTIPIRRTNEQEILKASSFNKLRRKFNIMQKNRINEGHEYAVGSVTGDAFYGAKATINVWAPHVETDEEFSLGQIWIVAGKYGVDLNTIEVGWQVYPALFGDNQPRLFTYWTRDAYGKTGCHNLLCPGFVQTSKQIVVGAAIRPVSTYNGNQIEITLTISKDPKNGNWLLKFGSDIEIGYWPSSLFTHLNDKATNIEFGGEIVNTKSKWSHTSTQMGSGHFAEEGYGKSSYFKNLQVMDSNRNFIPLPNLQVTADNQNCYNIQAGTNVNMGNYFYYGGPGKNDKCP